MGKIFEALEKSKQYTPIIQPETTIGRLTKADQLDGQGVATSLPKAFELTDSHLDRSLVSFFKPQSVEAEQFRRLAANVLFHNADNRHSCFLITSAKEAEGKSFLTANLAISLAKSLEEPVLLLDCDLRRPRQHTLFGLGNVAGLSDHLTKGVDISALIQKTPIRNLSLLPAGAKSFHSAEMLSSKRVSQLLLTLKKIHREKIILIDSPPPVSTAEPLAIARKVDGVILVVKFEDTPQEMVEDLIKNIGKEKILGVVLNRFNRWFKSHKQYGIPQ